MATTSRKWLAGAVLALAAVWGLGVRLTGQSAPAPAPAAASAPMAEAVFKNVQILKGIPLDQFMGTMGFFSAATGLNCTDCHVDESGGDWGKYADDNDLKRTSRKMMLMVQAINRANFNGRQVVTCTTCHRGFRKPAVMPSLNLLYAEPPTDEPGDPFAQAPNQPAPDVLLDRFIEASGGAARLASITSLVGKGTYKAFDDADTSPMELYANAQGQRTIVAHLPSGLSTWVYDGRNGWIAGPSTDRPTPLIDITGQELEGLRFESLALFPTTLKGSLRNMRTSQPQLVEGDREVQCVQGETPAGTVVTLCFDSTTGLLMRVIRYGDSPIGRLVTRVDIDAYRDVSGIKVPSKWTVAWLSGRNVYELTSVQPNVRIEASRFNKPAVSTPAS